MAKTKEELNKLKQDYESLSSKLKELSEDELKEVIGGNVILIREESRDLDKGGSRQDVIGGWSSKEHNQ